MRIILLILLFCAFTVKAQENLQVLFGYDGVVSGTSYVPTIQRMDSSNVEINISYNFIVGNSSISYGSLQDIYRKKSLTKSDIDDIISEMDDENRIGFSQDFVVFGFGLKHQLFNKPLYWNFTISDRMSFNAYYDKELPQLLWQGNEQFVGETVDLSNTYLSGYYLRDYALGFNRSIYKANGLNVNAAFRFNYYQGIAGLSMEQSNIKVTTAEGAKVIDLSYDVQYRHAGLSHFNLLETAGTGYGVDFGASIDYENKIFLHLGVIDWGSVSFSENITSNNNSLEVRYEGLDKEGIADPIAFVDRLLSPESSETIGSTSFKKNLGTKLIMLASYSLERSNFLSSNKTIHAYYRQGLSSTVDGHDKPMIALGFNNTMFRIFNAGINSTWTSNGRIVYGVLVGISLDRFDFSIYSNDFTGHVSPQKAKGAGFGFLIKANFF